MSTEGAKAPPEEGVPAPAAAAAAPEEAAKSNSTNGNTNSEKPAATSNSDNGKVSAYDKKWLENLNVIKPCIGKGGTMDYSSLDEEESKRMQNFVKDQRKCYRKRENNEPTPMTDYRYRLLCEANFNFKPSETNKKGKSTKKKQDQGKSNGLAKKSTESKKKSPAPAKAEAQKEPATKLTPKKEAATKSGPKVAEATKPTPSKKEAAKPTPKTKEGTKRTPNKAKTFDSVEKVKLAKKPTPMKTEEEPGSDSNMSASKSSKPSSSSKSPKSSSKSSTSAAAGSAKKKSGKPTYIEMVHDAIVTLKDRTGSSMVAINKWIMANHEHVKSLTPAKFKNHVSGEIKKGVKDGRYIKVKSSFKINPEWTKKRKAAARAKDATKKKAEKARQKEADKIKQQKKAELAKKKSEEEKKRKEKVMTPEEKAEAERKKKRKAEAEAKKKFIEQQMRKRRYPIEDTKLHNENKEWGIKPREHVTRRPPLPQTLTCIVPPHLRSNTPKKAWGSVATASAAGKGSLLGGENDRGLITDAIHVFHFFGGDVGLEDVDHPVPKFSLKTLFYALDEVLNGNAKAAKSLPPLITHLFATALRMLTTPVDGEDDDLDPVDLRLKEDISKLSEGLNALSWSQVCFFYMDMMDRFYTSDISLEEGVSPGESKLSMNYLWNEDAMDVDDKEIAMKTEHDEELLPEGYNGYVGNPQGVLAKGFAKLQTQSEPWTLKADELMAMLRTLTDDILAKRHDLAEDIAGRSAKLHELQKARRAAVVKFNKVRLAYEGPKKPTRPKKASSEGDSKDDDKKNDDVEDKKEEDEKPFVPTATKKQFEAAEKAHMKAIDAYENGLNKLISRTEPLCFDRNFNAIYFFRHDPTMLHIEEIKQTRKSLPSEIKSLGPELTPFSNWHFIDTKPLFEQFISSLDDRGQRENETLQICSNITVLKRKLLDDKNVNNRALAREREKEGLERRLENAKSACDAEDGRRSGRLAGMAQSEQKKVEAEIELMTKAHTEEERQEKLGREQASDYSVLTGLQMVKDLFAGQRSTRSHKNTAVVENEATLLANVPSHKLWMDNKTGGNGTLNILVDALIAFEKKCNDLSPWAREDITREAWRKQLSDASCAWAIDCVMQLGRSADDIAGEDGGDEQLSPTKKQKIEPVSGTSLMSIVNTVRSCLRDLELRAFEISGRKKAIEEADTAAENEDDASDEDDNEELNKRRDCWKVKINALHRINPGKYALVRDIIVASITVARKSHLNNVAADLKLALQLMRPHAGGEARLAAIKVLEKYGGYDGSEDDDDDLDFDELAKVNTSDKNASGEEDGAAIASLLCDEVRMISGSIGGDDFADKDDWRDAIKDCKSVSRLAVMIQSFLAKADDALTQIKGERDNLDKVLGLNAKRTGRTKTTINKKRDSSTAIWCNAKLTTKLVNARVQGFPLWPARVCEPIDPVVADALEGSGYILVSSVGNPGMFLIAEEDMVDFSEEIEEDESQYDKSTLEELQESISIAKKLWRVRNRGVASPWSKKSRPRFSEEKKTEA